MKLCTFELDGARQAGILRGDCILSVAEVNAKRGARFPKDLFELIQEGQIEALAKLSDGLDARTPLESVRLCLPYRRPGKIWCIGLNYKSHAEDLNEKQPEEPGSFMKPSTALFEPGGEIVLPPERLTREVDAEGELALVFGKRIKNVTRENWRQALVGFTVAMDLTALDILARNPRYLTRSKAFDTFFSFGPVIVTVDEVGDIDALEVITEHNGKEFSRDFVRNMRHRPDSLVHLHSEVMTFEPGDILSTGCPKGARIQPGDAVAAHVPGVGRLEARVTRAEG